MPGNRKHSFRALVSGASRIYSSWMPTRRLISQALSVLMVACISGCIAGNISGRLVNSEQGFGVDGAIVSLHEVGIGVPKPGDKVEEKPAAIDCALSGVDGSFSFPFGGPPIIGPSTQRYRLRFHRADYHDAVFDFDYDGRGWIGHSVRTGEIKLRPRWLDGPTTQAPD
jgi:hypothetical protein